MANFDLEEMSLAELKQLKKEVDKAIDTFEGRRKVEARAKVEAVAKNLGYSLAELVDSDLKRSRPSALPRYQHPNDATITWSGRGRRPRWFTDALSTGKASEDLLIH